MKNSLVVIRDFYRTACCSALLQVQRHSNILLLLLGFALLTGGLNELCSAQEEYINYGAQYDDTKTAGLNENLTKLIQGAFGSLVMVVSGLGAFVAAAMGAYKASATMLVIAVGAFIARGTISVMSGYDNVKY